MSSKLRIPSPLRRFTNNQSEIEVDGDNVQKVLEQLFDAHPEIKNQLPLMKAKPEFAKEAFDIADAIVVGRAAAATLLPDRPKKVIEPEPVPEVPEEDLIDF